jgi:hypothetical protein
VVMLWIQLWLHFPVGAAPLQRGFSTIGKLACTWAFIDSAVAARP